MINLEELFLVQLILMLAILYFTMVYHVVGTVNNDVYLCTVS